MDFHQSHWYVIEEQINLEWIVSLKQNVLSVDINLHHFFHIHIAQSREENIFEVKINIDWTIVALNNIHFVNVQRVQRNHT